MTISVRDCGARKWRLRFIAATMLGALAVVIPAVAAEGAAAGAAPAGPRHALDENPFAAMTDRTPRPVPNLAFIDDKGATRRLEQFRGKLILLNVWATWCPPCRREMPDLDVLQRYFGGQGLVILSITDEDPFKVSSFIGPTHYTPDVLLDPGDKVHKEFHVYGIPKTFVFNRDGKLIGETIDESTRKQFLALLSRTDLHP